MTLPYLVAIPWATSREGGPRAAFSLFSEATTYAARLSRPSPEGYGSAVIYTNPSGFPLIHAWHKDGACERAPMPDPLVRQFKDGLARADRS